MCMCVGGESIETLCIWLVCFHSENRVAVLRINLPVFKGTLINKQTNKQSSKLASDPRALKVFNVLNK